MTRISGRGVVFETPLALEVGLCCANADCEPSSVTTAVPGKRRHRSARRNTGALTPRSRATTPRIPKSPDYPDECCHYSAEHVREGFAKHPGRFGNVVADAVYVERVSATEFPANREINRENRKNGPWATTKSSLNAVSMRGFIDIPCEN
jgi:hypothetical protein